MELLVETADGHVPPGDTFLSIKAGNCVKQSRFAGPPRRFRFPDPALKHCDIEVFRKVGATTFFTSSIVFGELALGVPCDLPDVPGLSLRIYSEHVAAASSDGSPTARRLAAQPLEANVVAALREVIRAKPNDPHEFLKVVQSQSAPTLAGRTESLLVPRDNEALPAGPLELYVELTDHGSAPPETSIALRIGDVRKQASFVRSRRFRFPEGALRHNLCHVEIYTRLGGARAQLEDASGAPEVHIATAQKGWSPLILRVSARPPEQGVVDKKMKVQMHLEAAKKYLTQHRIEENLGTAIGEARWLEALSPESNSPASPVKQATLLPILWRARDSSEKAQMSPMGKSDDLSRTVNLPPIDRTFSLSPSQAAKKKVSFTDDTFFPENVRRGSALKRGQRSRSLSLPHSHQPTLDPEPGVAVLGGFLRAAEAAPSLLPLPSPSPLPTLSEPEPTPTPTPLPEEPPEPRLDAPPPVPFPMLASVGTWIARASRFAEELRRSAAGHADPREAWLDAEPGPAEASATDIAAVTATATESEPHASPRQQDQGAPRRDDEELLGARAELAGTRTRLHQAEMEVENARAESADARTHLEDLQRRLEALELRRAAEAREHTEALAMTTADAEAARAEARAARAEASDARAEASAAAVRLREEERMAHEEAASAAMRLGEEARAAQEEAAAAAARLGEEARAAREAAAAAVSEAEELRRRLAEAEASARATTTRLEEQMAVRTAHAEAEARAQKFDAERAGQRLNALEREVEALRAEDHSFAGRFDELCLWLATLPLECANRRRVAAAIEAVLPQAAGCPPPVDAAAAAPPKEVADGSDDSESYVDITDHLLPDLDQNEQSVVAPFRWCGCERHRSPEVMEICFRCAGWVAPIRWGMGVPNFERTLPVIASGRQQSPTRMIREVSAENIGRPKVTKRPSRPRRPEPGGRSPPEARAEPTSSSVTVTQSPPRAMSPARHRDRERERDSMCAAAAELQTVMEDVDRLLASS